MMKVKDFIRIARPDEFGQFIVRVNDKGEEDKIIDIRAWGIIQKYFRKGFKRDRFVEAEKYQVKLCEWLSDAINEKIERENYGDEFLNKKHELV